MARTDNLTNFLTDIADTIRNKTGSQSTISAEDFDTEITTIATDGTATADDIIYPKTAYSQSGKITGAIIPTYESSGITIGKTITNNTNLGIYDIRNDLNLALVGNKQTNSFYIAPVGNDGISLTEATQVNMSSIISNDRYTFQDVKFDIASPLSNIINIFGVGTYTITDMSWSRGSLWTVIFAFNYNISTKEITQIKKVDWETRKNSVYDRVHAIANAHIYIKEENQFVYKQDRPLVYEDKIINNGAKLYQFANGNLTNLRDFACADENIDDTEAQISDYLLVYYNVSMYRIYNVYNNAMTLLANGTDSSRVAIIDNDKYLIGTNLYNMSGTIINDYSAILSTSTYKKYLEGYLYEFDVTNSIAKIYEYDETNYGLTLINTISGVANSYNFSSADVKLKPYVNPKYAIYGNSSSTSYHIDYLEETQTMKSLTVNNKTYIDTSDATAQTSNLLTGTSAYVSGGKIIGTMSNNGTLNYTPTTSQQTIPLGYTSGGSISAVTSSIDSNIIAENIKKDITILGVTGTLEEGTGTVLNVTGNNVSVSGTTLIFGGGN